MAKTQNQKEILEIGYGTGLLTTILLENNFKVIAIDKSTKGKSYLEQKCQSFSFYNKLNIENIDIIEYSTNKKFNLIFAVDEFMIHFLTLNELEIFLKKINFLLNENGVFVTDMRNKQENDFNIVHHYPIYTYPIEVQGVKYISCISWNILTKDNIVLVHFKYEELNSKGEILKSYIKILRQGRFRLEELIMVAEQLNFKIEIREEKNLDCNVFIFTKIKPNNE